jgi:hypothetical protein
VRIHPYTSSIGCIDSGHWKYSSASILSSLLMLVTPSSAETTMPSSAAKGKGPACYRDAARIRDASANLATRFDVKYCGP